MRLQRDIGAGFLNSVWSAAVSLACVPVYVHFLGIEAYGIIGFYATTQALLQVLDLGLSATINREVARSAALGKPAEAANLLQTLSFVYWCVALAIGVSIFLMADPIAARWLQSRSLPQSTIEQSVILMGLVIACRWPIGLYQGVLLGSLRIAVSSGINMLMVTLANGGALLVLWLVSARVEAFFAWQALVGLLYALTMRYAAWRSLGAAPTARFDAAALMRTWRFAAGMSAVAVSGIVLLQMDKVILSRMLALDDFGRYSLAWVVAGGLYVILAPTFNIIYPRMSALVAKREDQALAVFYRMGTRVLSATLFPVAATAAVFSQELLLLWTRDAALAQSAAPLVSVVLIGTALNGAMHFPYALQLASGLTRLPLVINAILLGTMLPLTVILTLKFGALGGAMAWASLNLVYLLVGTWLTHRHLLPRLGWSWLLVDVTAPAALATATIWIVGSAIRRLGYTHTTTFLMACALAMLCSAGLMLLTLRTRWTMRMP